MYAARGGECCDLRRAHLGLGLKVRKGPPDGGAEERAAGYTVIKCDGPRCSIFARCSEEARAEERTAWLSIMPIERANAIGELSIAAPTQRRRDGAR